MLHRHTLERLHALKLTGMATALEQQLAQPASQELSFEERFALLLDQEILYRDNRRLTRLLKAARLRVGACVEDIDYRHPRGIERPFMSTLTSCQWIQRHQNLAITGPTCTGKTWLVCALGNQA
jgi:DNA replication protein DnaC